MASPAHNSRTLESENPNHTDTSASAETQMRQEVDGAIHDPQKSAFIYMINRLQRQIDHVKSGVALVAVRALGDLAGGVLGDLAEINGIDEDGRTSIIDMINGLQQGIDGLKSIVAATKHMLVGDIEEDNQPDDSRGNTSGGRAASNVAAWVPSARFLELRQYQLDLADASAINPESWDIPEAADASTTDQLQQVPQSSNTRYNMRSRAKRQATGADMS